MVVFCVNLAKVLARRRLFERGQFSAVEVTYALTDAVVLTRVWRGLNLLFYAVVLEKAAVSANYYCSAQECDTSSTTNGEGGQCEK